MVLASNEFGQYPNEGALLRNALDAMMEAEALSDYSLRPNKNTQSSYPAKGLANPFESNAGSEYNATEGCLDFSDSVSEISDKDEVKASKKRNVGTVTGKKEVCKKQKLDHKAITAKSSSSSKRKYEEEMSHMSEETLSEETEKKILQQIDKWANNNGSIYKYWYEYFKDNVDHQLCTFVQFTQLR